MKSLDALYNELYRMRQDAQNSDNRLESKLQETERRIVADVNNLIDHKFEALSSQWHTGQHNLCQKFERHFE